MIQAMLRVHGEIKRIPNNRENYISFSLGNLRFIDSVSFLLSSLDYLAKGSDPILSKCYREEAHIGLL